MVAGGGLQGPGDRLGRLWAHVQRDAMTSIVVNWAGHFRVNAPPSESAVHFHVVLQRGVWVLVGLFSRAAIERERSAPRRGGTASDISRNTNLLV